MTVILEFKIQEEDFTLGQVLADSPDMQIELERIVPTGTQVLPFVWATGGDHEAFEESVRESHQVKELLALDRLEDSGLYRIEWVEHPTDILEGIARTDATVLDVRRDDEWVFRLRFTDHDRLSQFYNYCTERNIAIHIDRTYTLTEKTEQKHDFGLSQEQREALVLALRRGYFATPSESSLDDLADELGITPQAVSNRIRRGNEKVLRTILLSSVSDF